MVMHTFCIHEFSFFLEKLLQSHIQVTNEIYRYI